MLENRPQTIDVLCVRGLHHYTVPTTAVDLECPVCGCKFGRIQAPATSVVLQTNQVYLTESPPTWLDTLKSEGGE